ncbi:MAG: dihydrolipoamide succinyltransferase [Gemmatimonas sp. SM23_52]|nr:MAG: dihydrolipoamide succinyltransferase [Gemmatimonas sp. SM23_52]
MAVEIVVPSLGESVSEATVATWLKKQGQAVAADEVVLELETDKATLEIPAPAGGVLSEILVQEGEDVEVGAILGRIEESAEAAVAPVAWEPKPAESAASKPAAEVAAPAGAPAATASAPPGLDPAAVPRSGPGGTVTLEDLQSFFARASQDAVERSGPAVRKLIADHGLDPAEIAASGRDGRITKEDVLSFLSKGSAALAPAPAAASPAVRSAGPAPAPAGERREERVRMSRLRRTIAARLKEAQNTAAILTTFNEVDMSVVIELRKRYRELFEQKHGVRLGFMSFFVKAVVGALKEMPQVNASIEGDEIVYKYYYDIGIAVSTDAGLKVPVIRDAGRKSFAQLEREIADLAARARDGSLTLEEMEGGTFSITNAGVFGSLLSTPILNPPQSAILGLHKIEERPIVIDGEIAVRPMMYLAMSYDHRMIDGRESVTFLVRVKELIENPDRLMLEV